MSNREKAFDTIKGISCLMVLGIHVLQSCTIMPDWKLTLTIIYFLFTPCDGLFLMVTGCLLLREKRLTWKFFGRRIVDVFTPLVVVSLFISMVREPHIATSMHQTMLSVFLKPAWPSYWYFYALGGIYVLALPMNILYRCYDNRFLSYALVLWFLELGVLLGLVAAGPGAVLLETMGEYPLSLSVLFWGFLPLGKILYLNTKEHSMKWMLRTSFAFIFLSISLIIVGVRSSNLQDFLLQNYLSPISVCITGFAFVFLLKFHGRMPCASIIEFLGRHSLCFCLLHILPWAFHGTVK